MTRTNDTLIHPTGLDGLLRYAQHQRNANWRPPMLSISISELEEAAEQITPHQLGLWLLFASAYMRAPLLDAESGAKSPRRFACTTAALTRRLGEKVTTRDVEAWIKAGLVWTSTVDGRSINGSPTVRTRTGLGLGLGRGLGQDSDEGLDADVDQDAKPSEPSTGEREADDQFTVAPVGLTDWSAGR
jgi:hypothetical protein